MLTPSRELYMRWLQFGTFSPLMQYHGITPREPWFFGKTAEKCYAFLTSLRMALRPTLISLGKEAASTGIPIMRPMTMEFPNDPRFVAEETQYMLGPDLLVAPILEEGAAGRSILIPEGKWQHLLYPLEYDGPAEIELPVGYLDHTCAGTAWRCAGGGIGGRSGLGRVACKCGAQRAQVRFIASCCSQSPDTGRCQCVCVARHESVLSATRM